MSKRSSNLNSNWHGAWNCATKFRPVGHGQRWGD